MSRSYAALNLLIATAALSLTVSAFADPLRVKTAEGKVHGKFLHDGLVRAFQGMPYAAPPVGPLRWKAPQPVASWKGEFDATHYGHHCVQGVVFRDMVFPDPGPSEDCLSLNVYTPAKSKGKLPVMFWIHGGGYAGGASSEPRHNGDFLPTKGVILVTINYRLGLFGFFSLAELAAEQGGPNGGSSGNYGLMDMVAGLQWVRKNISSFGGDPGNVTIFGESAGSSAVSTLMAAPSARGLFSKAIGESGAAVSSGPMHMKTFADVGPRNAEWMNSAGATKLADLRAMPADRLIEEATKGKGLRTGPIIDGSFLKESVLDTYLGGRQARVPLIAGFNRDEGYSMGESMTADKWRDFVTQRYPDVAQALLRLYPGTTDAEASRSATDFGGDSFIAYNTWKWIELHRKTGESPVYRYKLDLASPPSKFHQGEYAFHSDDIEYVFGTLDTRPEAVWREEDRKLSDEMMTYWTNFAKTGDPGGPGLPAWPRYTEGDPVLHLDNPITSRPDENRARYEFWLGNEDALSQPPRP